MCAYEHNRPTTCLRQILWLRQRRLLATCFGVRRVIDNPQSEEDNDALDNFRPSSDCPAATWHPRMSSVFLITSLYELNIFTDYKVMQRSFHMSSIRLPQDEQKWNPFRITLLFTISWVLVFGNRSWTCSRRPTNPVFARWKSFETTCSSNEDESTTIFRIHPHIWLQKTQRAMQSSRVSGNDNDWNSMSVLSRITTSFLGGDSNLEWYSKWIWMVSLEAKSYESLVRVRPSFEFSIIALTKRFQNRGFVRSSSLDLNSRVWASWLIDETKNKLMYPLNQRIFQLTPITIVRFWRFNLIREMFREMA